MPRTNRHKVTRPINGMAVTAVLVIVELVAVDDELPFAVETEQ
jgi:hypothetical protein